MNVIIIQKNGNIEKVKSLVESNVSLVHEKEDAVSSNDIIVFHEYSYILYFH